MMDALIVLLVIGPPAIALVWWIVTDIRAYSLDRALVEGRIECPLDTPEAAQACPLCGRVHPPFGHPGG